MKLSKNGTSETMSPNLRQHSEIKYSQDLTSQQIWTILNDLLYEASAPLAVYGDMGIETAISCLVLSTNNRRRLAADVPTVFLEKLFYELAQTLEHDDDHNRLEMLEMLFAQGVERNIFTDHINISLQLDQFPAKIDRLKLYAHVTTYLEYYNTFKRDVVYRYYYMTQRESAKNHYSKSLYGLKASQDDMFHVYIISAMRALDKFIPFRGSLTSYIQQWFQNAEGSSDFMVYEGEAFSLNRSTRKAIHDGDLQLNNSSIPLEDRAKFLIEEKDEDSGYVSEFIHHCANLPNASLVFLAQAFPYNLNQEQKRRIRENNLQQKLKNK